MIYVAFDDAVKDFLSSAEKKEKVILEGSDEKNPPCSSEKVLNVSRRHRI